MRDFNIGMTVLTPKGEGEIRGFTFKESGKIFEKYFTVEFPSGETAQYFRKDLEMK